MKEPEEVKEEGKLFRLGPNLSCAKGDHSFVYRSAGEIECTKCPVGYPIGPGTVLENGKIKIHGEELVI